MDGFWYPFEGVLSSVLECDAGAEDEFFHGAGDEHFRRSGERSDACSEMHRDARDAAVALDDLTGMKPGAYLESELANLCAYCHGATHGSCRAIEDDKEAVADGI